MQIQQTGVCFPDMLKSAFWNSHLSWPQRFITKVNQLQLEAKIEKESFPKTQYLRKKIRASYQIFKKESWNRRLNGFNSKTYAITRGIFFTNHSIFQKISACQLVVNSGKKPDPTFRLNILCWPKPFANSKWFTWLIKFCTRLKPHGENFIAEIRSWQKCIKCKVSAWFSQIWEDEFAWKVLPQHFYFF